MCGSRVYKPEDLERIEAMMKGKFPVEEEKEKS
jgi:hypothetical protein